MSASDSRKTTRQHRRFTDATRSCESIVGPGVSITGDLHGKTDMECRGTIDGNLELDGFLWLCSDGRIEGNISATNLLVEGTVRGNIRVDGKAELRSSCHVEGDIVARGVAIAEGGYFEGTITMEGRSSSREEVEFKERRSLDG